MIGSQGHNSSAYEDPSAKKPDSVNPVPMKGHAKQKASRKQAILESITATKAAKDEENHAKILEACKTKLKMIQSRTSRRLRFLDAQAYLKGLSNSKKDMIGNEIELFIIDILLDAYTAQYKSSDQLLTDRLSLAALIFARVRSVAGSKELTRTSCTRLRDIIHVLRLPEFEMPEPVLDRPLPFRCLQISDRNDLAVTLSAQDFQLLHCGPYFDRNLESSPDSRVIFEPDRWQRAVLDELDLGNSIFVVAPTSSGKTFISFYAMEQVLRANNDNVLVYVAPTKVRRLFRQ